MFFYDWEQRKLSEVANHRGGTALEKYFHEDGKYKVISIGSYGLDSKYVDQNIRALSNEITDSRIVNSGELTMVLNDKTANGTIIGRSLLIESGNEYVINQRTEIISPKENFNSDFAYTILNGLFREKVKRIVQGGTQIYVNYPAVSNLTLEIPSIEEQQKIGTFFKQLDDTLALHQRKLDKLKQLKQGYLQQLFPQNGEKIPRVRFAYFEDVWEQRKLRTLLIKNSKKNKDLTIKNVESISNRTGFTKQTEQFDEYSVASADLSNYYVITEQQFAYNPSRINVGSIAYKPIGDDTSVVSPLYVSFSTKKILNDSFLWNWFKTSSFENQRQRLSEGGVRDTLSFNQLSEMSIVLPQYLEQVKIGNFFKQLDFLITLHQEKLKQLKTCKKALLQKMFI